MRKYLPSNDGNVVDAIPTPLPDPYGSVDDTRVEDIVQLREIARPIPEVSYDAVNTAIEAAFTPGDFSLPSPDKQIFQFTVAIGVDRNIELPFKAKSVRIDNLTNQWLFIPNLRVFVPPDWFGAVFTASGMLQLTVAFQAPGGFVQPAPTADTIVNVIAYFERVPDVAGTKRT